MKFKKGGRTTTETSEQCPIETERFFNSISA
jgi:hypothetical protein